MVRIYSSNVRKILRRENFREREREREKIRNTGGEKGRKERDVRNE